MRLLEAMTVAAAIVGTPVGIAQGLVTKAKVSRSELAQGMFLQESIFEIRAQGNSMRLSAMTASEVRCEVREQLVTDFKCAVVASRREMGKSLTEARARASEQARKFAAEMKEVSRARRLKAEL